MKSKFKVGQKLYYRNPYDGIRVGIVAAVHEFDGDYFYQMIKPAGGYEWASEQHCQLNTGERSTLSHDV